MAKSFWDHPIETIEKALHIRKQIESLEASLKKLYGDGTQPLVIEKPASVKDGRKGKRSAATIAKMKAAQKARWAKKKKSSPAATKPAKGAKTKRVVSAASRAKMAASQRARRTKEKIAPELSMANKLVW
jgi:hypothetical protein